MLFGLGWLCLCSLGSCCSEPQAKDVRDNPSIPLSFQEMPIKALLGIPFPIAFLDSLFIGADYVDGKSLLLYDFKNDVYVRTLSIGQGPGEVSGPIDIIGMSRQEKTVTILQRSSGIIRTYALSDLWKDSVSAYRDEITVVGTDRAVRLPEGYACAGFSDVGKGILSFYDEKENLTGYADVHPEWDVSGNYERKYWLAQGHLAYNDKSGKLMLASGFASEIHFFQKHNGNWELDSSFSTGSDDLERRILETNDWSFRGDGINRCLEACSTGRYFYVLYDGRKFSERLSQAPSAERERGDHLYVIRFTADGELDVMYEVDPTIVSFYVSPDDAWVYAALLGKDGEYVIGRAKVPE